MPIILYVCLIISLLVSSAGCSTVQERQALSDWKEEDKKFSDSASDVGNLPELGENSALNDYILYALLNNPGLRASFDRWKAALEKVAPAKTLPDPRLTYANYIEEVETRVGAQKYSIGLAQTFPWFGKLDLKSKIALQAANTEQKRFEAAKLDLINRVKQIYYEYAYLAQSINVTKDNMTLVTHFESVARARYKSGVGLQNAVIKIQVELGKLEDRLLSLKDSIRPVAAKLNMAMNRPVYVPLPLPDMIPDDKMDFDVEELVALLKAENPNLKALDFMAEKENYAIELARKDYFPDFTLGVNYIGTDSRLDTNPPDNGKDPFIANLSINIPIWWKKYEAQGRGAEARHRAVLTEKKEKENALIADLEVTLYKLRDAERKIGLYRDTLLPKAEQNVKINQLAFTSDKASFLDLIDSQRVLLEFQLAYKRALTDYAQSLAQIEMFVGGTIERETK